MYIHRLNFSGTVNSSIPQLIGARGYGCSTIILLAACGKAVLCNVAAKRYCTSIGCQRFASKRSKRQCAVGGCVHQLTGRCVDFQLAFLRCSPTFTLRKHLGPCGNTALCDMKLFTDTHVNLRFEFIDCCCRSVQPFAVDAWVDGHPSLAPVVYLHHILCSLAWRASERPWRHMIIHCSCRCLEFCRSAALQPFPGQAWRWQFGLAALLLKEHRCASRPDS